MVSVRWCGMKSQEEPSNSALQCYDITMDTKACWSVLVAQLHATASIRSMSLLSWEERDVQQ